MRVPPSKPPGAPHARMPHMQRSECGRTPNARRKHPTTSSCQVTSQRQACTQLCPCHRSCSATHRLAKTTLPKQKTVRRQEPLCHHCGQPASHNRTAHAQRTCQTTDTRKPSRQSTHTTHSAARQAAPSAQDVSSISNDTLTDGAMLQQRLQQRQQPPAISSPRQAAAAQPLAARTLTAPGRTTRRRRRRTD